MAESKTVYSYEEALEASRVYFNCDPADPNDNLPAKVFLDKYALQDNDGNLLEKTPDQMHRRIAREFARIEKKKFKKPLTEDEIFALIDRFGKIIPQGSPMYGIGNKHQTISLSNCYVIPSPLDAYSSIMRADEHLVQISKRRGGVGVDVSNLRPSGTPTANAARTSTGTIPFCSRYSNSIREVGQCLAADTKVLTRRGLVRIAEVVIGDDVWTENEWVPVVDKVRNRKPTVVVETKAGRQVECSVDHVFHTADGEMPVRDMEPGTRISAIVGGGWSGETVRMATLAYERHPYNNSNRLVERNLPDELSTDAAYWLGYSFGDGYVDNGCSISLALSNDWPLIDEKLNRVAREEWGFAPTYKGGINGNYKVLRVASTQFERYLARNGFLKQHAGKLRLPEKLLQADTPTVMAFIAGFFDADGTVVVSKKLFRIASIDGGLLRDFQSVLLAHGVVSKVAQTTRKHPWRTIYSLSINGRRSQSRLRKLLHESIKVSTAPHWKVKNRDFTRTQYQIGDFSSNSSRHSYVTDNRQFITYSTAERLCSDLVIKDRFRLLQDEVVSISSPGDAKEVYDLVLADTHLFFANGLYAHNSGRRGALMITQSIHHPESVMPWDDAEGAPFEVEINDKDLGSFKTDSRYFNPRKIDFATMKYDRSKVTGANVSLRVTDEFLTAVEKGEKYQQRWPVDKSATPKVEKWVNARAVWDKIIHSAWQTAEPGVLFWDNIIRESIPDCYAKFGFKTESTNPCGEIVLSAFDSCRLLLLNLFSFVVNPFTPDAYFDYEAFYETVKIAQRLMDDLIDLEEECLLEILEKIDADPEPGEEKHTERQLWQNILKACRDGRRTGTGITALGDAIAACGIGYGTEDGVQMTERIYKTLKYGAYVASVEMAKEIGTFPVWDHELEKDNPFLSRFRNDLLDLGRSNLKAGDARKHISGDWLWEEMKKYGRRNIALLTTAPAGSVSLLTRIIGNYGSSSGIEPQFDITPYTRKKKGNPGDKNFRVDSVDQNGDHWMHFTVAPAAVKDWMAVTGETELEKSPWHKHCAVDLDWTVRVELQAAAQKHVDHSISSTVNLPADVTVEKVKEIYVAAWKAGCKGITVYRDGCRSGVLIRDDKKEEAKAGIPKTTAPKRPQTIPCDVYHIKVKGTEYFVLVGLFSSREPYEIFAGKNGMIAKGVKTGTLTKMARGKYKAVFDDGSELASVAEHLNDEQEAITRMASMGLRHGADIQYVVHQLEKVTGDLTSFSKAMARALKKYIADDTPVSGEICEKIIDDKPCGGQIARQDGCKICRACGDSKCS